MFFSEFQKYLLLVVVPQCYSQSFLHLDLLGSVELVLVFIIPVHQYLLLEEIVVVVVLNPLPVEASLGGGVHLDAVL